jgi:hypothetical protein
MGLVTAHTTGTIEYIYVTTGYYRVRFDGHSTPRLVHPNEVIRAPGEWHASGRQM